MPEQKISWENPLLPFLEPLGFECLTCGHKYIAVGISQQNLLQMRAKLFCEECFVECVDGRCPNAGARGHRKKYKMFPYYFNKIKDLDIHATEIIGPTPCGHFLAERCKSRFGVFDPGKIKRMKKKGRLP